MRGGMAKAKADFRTELQESGRRVFDRVKLYLPKVNFGSVLYHYTNLDAAFSIINSQTLRLTSAHHLSDVSEKNYGANLYKKAVSSFAWCRPQLKTANLASIDVTATYLANVFSLTEADDLLSQWRAFANDPTNPGIVLGLDSSLLVSAHLDFPIDPVNAVRGIFRVIYA